MLPDVSYFHFLCFVSLLFYYTVHYTDHAVSNGLTVSCSQVAPYVAMLAEYDSRIPTTFFGVVALVAAILVTFLPETSNTPLPDTIEVIIIIIIMA